MPPMDNSMETKIDTRIDSTTRFYLNDQSVQTDVPAGLPVLDFVRDHQGFKGTKEGCREGDCGACTILLGRRCGDELVYESVTSCLLPIGDVEGCHVVTVEGLNREVLNRGVLNPVQSAMVEQGASQCGFCTPGIVVSLSSFLLETQSFDPQEAIVAIEGNICRCTGYSAIFRAIEQLCEKLGSKIDAGDDRIQALVRVGVLPEYFAKIAPRLKPIGMNDRRQYHSGRPLVAGGTDLYVQRNAEFAELAPLMVFRAGLGDIRIDGDTVHLGAAVTVEQFRRSQAIQELIPRLEAFTDLHSSQPIRRRATFAGNVVNASPIGDLTIMLLGLGADVHIAAENQQRSLKLKDFFTGYKQFDLQSGEIIEAFSFPVLSRPLVFNFEKVSKRRHLDIASVNSAFCAKIDNGIITSAHLSAGGVSPIPLYLSRASEFLKGKVVSADTVFEAAAIADAEISPISDIRGSAQYKRLLLRQLIFAHFEELFGLGEQLMAEAGR